MFRIKVEKVLNKDIETVFDALADHAGYTRFPGVTLATLVEEGEVDKNGVGALRHVKLAGMSFHERIVEFQRPTRLCYLIEKSSPLPFDHDFGTIDLIAEGGDTRVIWRSEGRVAVPVLGSLVFDKVVDKQGAGGFLSTLTWIDRH